MTMQELLKQLADGNFKVESTKPIAGTSNRIGTVQEIKFFATTQAGVMVHFEGHKWDVYFNPDGIEEGFVGRYFMRDLKPTVKESK